ncbi:hypothetical protein Salmuc_01921 [Salipiger mucosus DSM 16094]|uniref:Uncharacterized protein n=1 Tax=Salipiger mucosus DSM 16094 TaxID=1123237 RepID=S9Q971_9RHOB|nr:hypothetical protein Salmuc_01921 [Salipiger mucosus DSM 16094]
MSDAGPKAGRSEEHVMAEPVSAVDMADLMAGARDGGVARLAEPCLTFRGEL